MYDKIKIVFFIMDDHPPNVHSAVVSLVSWSTYYDNEPASKLRRPVPCAREEIKLVTATKTGCKIQ